mmetsp:Transcript_122833/g.262132  ORF Transcript_122833/g.262132 Transcript_122833/m.262132 type:complete len:299 (+) Transcript_122833:152-1048(+)
MFATVSRLLRFPPRAPVLFVAGILPVAALKRAPHAVPVATIILLDLCPGVGEAQRAVVRLRTRAVDAEAAEAAAWPVERIATLQRRVVITLVVVVAQLLPLGIHENVVESSRKVIGARYRLAHMPLVRNLPLAHLRHWPTACTGVHDELLTDGNGQDGDARLGQLVLHLHGDSCLHPLAHKVGVSPVIAGAIGQHLPDCPGRHIFVDESEVKCDVVQIVMKALWIAFHEAENILCPVRLRLRRLPAAGSVVPDVHARLYRRAGLEVWPLMTVALVIHFHHCPPWHMCVLTAIRESHPV